MPYGGFIMNNCTYQFADPIPIWKTFSLLFMEGDSFIDLNVDLAEQNLLYTLLSRLSQIRDETGRTKLNEEIIGQLTNKTSLDAKCIKDHKPTFILPGNRDVNLSGTMKAATDFVLNTPTRPA